MWSLWYIIPSLPERCSGWGPLPQSCTGEAIARASMVLWASNSGTLCGPEHPGEDPRAFSAGLASMGAWQAPGHVLRPQPTGFMGPTAKSARIERDHKAGEKHAFHWAVPQKPLQRCQQGCHGNGHLQKANRTGTITRLRAQDRKYNRVAPIAAQRIRFLIDSPGHFIHGQKATGKELRQKNREEKSASQAKKEGINGRQRAMACNANYANAGFVTCNFSCMLKRQIFRDQV